MLIQPKELLDKINLLESVLLSTNKTIESEHENFLQLKNKLENLVTKKTETSNEIDKCIILCHHKVLNGKPVLMSKNELENFEEQCNIGDMEIEKEKEKNKILDKIKEMGLSLESAKVAFELGINPEAANLYSEYIKL